MEKAYSCDIVRNNNPKLKRFGQYGIVLTNGWNCNYINYQDGFTAYCNVKHFMLVKRFEIGEKIDNEIVRECIYWGSLQLAGRGGERRLNRAEMWVLAQRYIRRAAVVV